MRAPAEDTVDDGDTRRLATFASSLAFDDIPRAVVEHALGPVGHDVADGSRARERNDGARIRDGRPSQALDCSPRLRGDHRGAHGVRVFGGLLGPAIPDRGDRGIRGGGAGRDVGGRSAPARRLASHRDPRHPGRGDGLWLSAGTDARADAACARHRGHPGVRSDGGPVRVDGEAVPRRACRAATGRC